MEKKCLESAIATLVDECLLQSRSIVQWKPADSRERLFEGTKEIVLFTSFFERGLSVLTSDFLWGLLFHWGIQLHHVTPNFILHISIFVHLCELFLGIKPHFDLF